MTCARRVFCALSVAVFSTVSLAKEGVAQSCADVYRDAVVNVQVDIKEGAERNFIFHQYCQQNGDIQSFFKDGKVGFPVEGIPLSIEGTGRFDRTKLTAFCKQGVESGAAANKDFGYQRYVTVDALRSFNDCIALENSGIKISHQTAHPESFMVYIKLLGVNYSGKLQFLQYDTDKMECAFNDTGKGVERDLAEEAEASVATQSGKSFVHQEIGADISTENIIVSCARKPVEDSGGRFYPRATFQMGTSSGSYSIVLPADKLNGFALASQAQAAFAEQAATLERNVESRGSWQQRAERFERKINELQLLEVYRGDNRLSADYHFPCGTNVDRAFMESLCRGRSGNLVYRAHRLVEDAPGGACGHAQWALVCVPN